LETSFQPLKKLTANHLPVILKSNAATRFKFFGIFHLHLQLTKQFTDQRLHECRYKHFEEGFGKDLQNYEVFSSVLRIRDVYPGSRIRLFSIPDPNCLHPGSASKNLSILTQKNGF
jgi:hypothetical protein